jgi:hypothetical protein
MPLSAEIPAPVNTAIRGAAELFMLLDYLLFEYIRKIVEKTQKKERSSENLNYFWRLRKSKAGLNGFAVMLEKWTITEKNKPLITMQKGNRGRYRLCPQSQPPHNAIYRWPIRLAWPNPASKYTKTPAMSTNTRLKEIWLL